MSNAIRKKNDTGMLKDISVQYLLVLAIGAFGYTALEIIFRGYTHWSMAVAGSVCFLFIYIINQKLGGAHLLLRAALGALVITAVEFFIGCLVNLVFKWHVWDYSGLRFNFLGQICPLYTAIWFAICIPAAYLCRYIRIGVFGYLQ